MKKLFSLVLSVVFLFSLTACDSTEEPSLYDRGLEIVSLTEEVMGNDAYLDMLSVSEPLRNIIAEAASGDYTQPSAVYMLSFPDSSALAFAGIEDSTALPESVLEAVTHRLYAAVISQVNAMGGAEVLAAASMCSVGKTFVSTTAAENTIYLYIYEKGCPIAVTFTIGEDHTVTATGNVILYKDFPCSSPEEMEAFWGPGLLQISPVQH